MHKHERPVRRHFKKLATSSLIRLVTKGQFAVYTAGNCVSLLGSWMQRIGCSLLVWEMTQSTFWLGILAAADLLPTVFIGPFAGAAADRWNPLKLNRICQMVLTAIALIITVLIYLDLLSLGVLISLIALQGSIIALCQPARLSLVQDLVVREDVPAAVAINSMSVNLARLVGPAIAGLMVVYLNVSWVFLTNAIVTAIFVVALGYVSIPARKGTVFGGSMLSGIVEGFRYLIRDEGMRAMLLLLLAGGATIRSIAEMLPAFADTYFSHSVTGLAILTSSMAFGSIAAGFSVGTGSITNGLPRKVILSWIGAAASVMVFSVCHSSSLLALGALAIGFFTSVGIIGTQTFVQLSAPPAMRGRALSVHGLLFRASPSLGALVLGLAADMLGLTLPALISGGVMMIVALLYLPAAARLGANLERGDAPLCSDE
ncbi:MFS transporter [Mesorhizobium sp. ANAO-SY3R2]|uniref:MFS transporter n=1 Tax=Mesorhizobium sp. ANAO-SY3R2 TaxID=3166644 RepID=UPI0036733B0A